MSVFFHFVFIGKKFSGHKSTFGKDVSCFGMMTDRNNVFVTFENNRMITDDFSLSDRFNILNFCILGMPRENLEGVAKDLSDSGFANPSLYKDQIFDGYSLTVQPLNISKWSGILQWCEYTNFSPSRIITVGDAGNDLEMLIHADKSIVIAGADKRLLDIADQVIPPPKVGGWSEILHFL